MAINKAFNKIINTEIVKQNNIVQRQCLDLNPTENLRSGLKREVHMHKSIHKKELKMEERTKFFSIAKKTKTATG